MQYLVDTDWAIDHLHGCSKVVMLYLHRVSRQEMAQLESRLESTMDRVESQIGELRERMAHSEGLLEGLREALTRRNIG